MYKRYDITQVVLGIGKELRWGSFVSLAKLFGISEPFSNYLDFFLGPWDLLCFAIVMRMTGPPINYRILRIWVRWCQRFKRTQLYFTFKNIRRGYLAKQQTNKNQKYNAHRPRSSCAPSEVITEKASLVRRASCVRDRLR